MDSFFNFLMKKKGQMNEKTTTPKGKAINLETHVEQAAGSVVSKT